MKILVIGNGGREHAIAWRLLQSTKVQQIVCIPGNGGTATLPRCRNLGLRIDDFEGIARFYLVNGFNLVIVGPEVPLAKGITDALQAEGIKVFGPSQAGAEIEASKAWAKALMVEAGIPTARAEVFTDAAAANAYVMGQGAPIVIKADGLAAGKGVTVAATVVEAQEAIQAAFSGVFGAAGSRVVIEECLVGEEASVLAFTDGKTIRPMLAAQDHKRIGEGDSGPNTGGMGAYAPAPLVTPEIMQRIQTQVLEPAIRVLGDRRIDYRGVLYAGLMISPSGEIKVIEFNCRFGDPETQVVLPLLETPLEDIALACVEQRLADLPPLAWRSGVATCVVLAAGGYPGDYVKGSPISGIEAAEATGALVFHAGTQRKPNALVTDGGRVLGVTAVANDLAGAIAAAYQGAAPIQFDNQYCRRDIGHRALPQL